MIWPGGALPPGTFECCAHAALEAASRPLPVRAETSPVEFGSDAVTDSAHLGGGPPF